MAARRKRQAHPTAWAAELAQRMDIHPVPYVTPFRQSVLQLLQTVPEGKVTTYKHMAAKLGCGSCQAIGQALKNNPFAPVVPCHRVVSASLRIGGFSGFTDPKSAKILKKVRLLKEEGVAFHKNTRTGQWVLDANAARQLLHTFADAPAGASTAKKAPQRDAVAKKAPQWDAVAKKGGTRTSQNDGQASTAKRRRGNSSTSSGRRTKKSRRE